MIDIRDHAGAFVGGNGNDKMLKVTVSSAQPINPSKYEVWLKADVVNEVVFYNNLPNTVNENDILIQKAGVEIVKNSDISKGKVILKLDEFKSVIPSNKVKVFDSTYYAIFSILSQALQRINGEYYVLEGHWNDGTKWIKFSKDEQYLVARQQNGQTIRLLDTINSMTVKTAIAGTINPNLFAKLDRHMKKIMVADVTNKKFFIYDYELNLIETLTFPTLVAISFASFDYERRLIWMVGGTHCYLYDFAGNLLLTNSSVANFSVSGFLYDKETDKLFISGHGNGSPGSVRVFNATTIASLTTLSGTTSQFNMTTGYANNKKSIFVMTWSSGATYHQYDKETLEVEKSFTVLTNGSYNPWGAYVDDERGILIYASGSTSTKVYCYDLNTQAKLWESANIAGSAFTGERNGDIGNKATFLDNLGNYYIFSTNTDPTYLNLVKIISISGVVTETNINALFGIPGVNFMDTHLL